MAASGYTGNPPGSGGGGSTAWTDITGKPSTFPPSAHGHPQSDITGLATALAGKQPAGSYAAAVHGHAVADVSGLQGALDLKAPLANPSFTGTVAGVSKAMVGLGNVTNTADADKPVSTLQQTALDGKLPLIRSWNGSAYVADTDGLIYVGPNDPGAVPDGSIWIDTTP